MTNNENEGHNGKLITEIASYATDSLKLLPNLILLHAGTNDLNRPVDPEAAPERLGQLIDQIMTACPNSTLLVAKIVPSADPNTMKRIKIFNDAVENLSSKYQKAGTQLLVVEMTDYVKVEDLFDSLHPNDRGYEKMATAWYKGVEDAASKGWLDRPPMEVPATVTEGQAVATQSAKAEAMSQLMVQFAGIHGLGLCIIGIIMACL